jgi:hypothetical protein
MRPGLVPGYNVDVVDIAKGISQAIAFGYDTPEYLMVAEYALRRHARGEEDGAERSALSGGIDLTSWYAIRAAACADGFTDAAEKTAILGALQGVKPAGRRSS